MKLLTTSLTLLLAMPAFAAEPTAEAQHPKPQNTLLAAARAGDERTVELLVAAGADPNAVDQFGRTPLACAKSGDIARKLIAAGAKVPRDGSLIGDMIACSASADAIRVVIEAQGQLDAVVAQKALISAANRDQAEVAELLLAHGAKANEVGLLPDNDPILPLTICTVSGAAKTAKVLIAHGADPNAGIRPGILLQGAIRNGRTEVARVLHDAGAKGVSELAFQIAMRDEKKIGELLQSAPDFAENPEFWDRVLPTAARTGKLAVVRVALGKGVPIVAPRGQAAAPGEDMNLNEENNALCAAASEGQHEVLAELLSRRGKGENANELHKPLGIAVWNSHPYERQRSAEDFEKCVKLLLDAGAPLFPTRLCGPLVSAAVFTRYPGGNPRVIEMLVAAGADPNPVMGKDKPQRLSDVIEASCKERGCGPLDGTVEAFEKAAKVVIKR